MIHKFRKKCTVQISYKRITHKGNCEIYKMRIRGRQSWLTGKNSFVSQIKIICGINCHVIWFEPTRQAGHIRFSGMLEHLVVWGLWLVIVTLWIAYAVAGMQKVPGDGPRGVKIMSRIIGGTFSQWDKSAKLAVSCEYVCLLARKIASLRTWCHYVHVMLLYPDGNAVNKTDAS